MKIKGSILAKLSLMMLILVLLVTGCFSTATDNSSNLKVGLNIGNVAPDFTINMNDGKTVKLSELRGKPVFLNFWATWCPPCNQEMPDIQKISTENKSVQIVAVNIKEAPLEVRSFLKARGYTYPVGFDTSGDISNLYMIDGIPTSIAIDAKGVIRFEHTGAMTYAQLRQWFTELDQTAK